MADTQQLEQDLHYVRQVVAQADQVRPRPLGIYWVWGIYVLVGGALLDVGLNYAKWFFWIAWPVCFAASVVLANRARKSAGVKPIDDRSGLFWWGGSVLVLLCCVGVAVVMPGVRGMEIGQLGVVMLGILYFLGGVHYDRNFLWLGPLLCVCGLGVGLVPHYGWTGLGIVFALGLIVPTFFAPHASGVLAPPATPAHG